MKYPASRFCRDATHSCAAALLSAVAALLLIIPAVAGDTPREADKLKEIQAIIERQGMEMPVHWQSRYPDQLLQYCSRFLEDLKIGKDISVIEPAVRTNDPNHTDLDRYQSACRDAKDPNAGYHNLSDIGTHGFRLYHIDLDGNTKNGPEEILYAEGNSRRFGNGAYRRVDLKQCTIRSFGHPCCNTTLTPQDTRIAITNVNAIIRYRGVLSVLEMEGEKTKGSMEFRYGINFWGVGTPNQCRFAWPYKPMN